jgi:hypothetical protein
MKVKEIHYIKEHYSMRTGLYLVLEDGTVMAGCSTDPVMPFEEITKLPEDKIEA